jgi:hypothetical protein
LLGVVSTVEVQQLHWSLISQLAQFKGFLVLISYIIGLLDAIKVVDQMEHFFIFLVTVERDYWNTIIYVEGKRINRVIYDNYVL